MGLRINTNIPSLVAQRSLKDTNYKKNEVYDQLSTGSRITKASDDAAGLAISENLKSFMRSTQQATRNANDAISFVQTAEGGLNEITNVLIRLRELAIQTSSDTLADKEREFADFEFQNLKEEIQRVANVTEYNGIKLLKGEGDQLDFQIGIKDDAENSRISYDVAKINVNLDNLDIGDIAVNDKESSREVLEKVDSALLKVAGQRADLGARQNRLAIAATVSDLSVENLSAANSRIRDTDYAEASAESARLNILGNAGISVLAQANYSNQMALKLLD